VQDIREILFCIKKSEYEKSSTDENIQMLFFTRPDQSSIEKTDEIFADQKMFEDESKEDDNEVATKQF
jgi:hypothetical protein